MAKKNIIIVDKVEDADLLLMIRTNRQLKDVLQDYDKITVPHLYVDLAYSNTISIGPLVYKNDTACLGCYIGRLAKNWGDMVPADEPQIHRIRHPAARLHRHRGGCTAHAGRVCLR